MIKLLTIVYNLTPSVLCGCVGHSLHLNLLGSSGGVFPPFLSACLSLLAPCAAVTPSIKVSVTAQQLCCLIIKMFPFITASPFPRLTSSIQQLRKTKQDKTISCCLFPGILYESMGRGREAPGTFLGPVNSTWNWNKNWLTSTRRTLHCSSPPALWPMTPPSSPSPRCCLVNQRLLDIYCAVNLTRMNESLCCSFFLLILSCSSLLCFRL